MKYLFLLILITGCVGQAVDVAEVPEEHGFFQVYFCPAEDCSGELSSFILSANSYVHCAFFDLDLENVISALEIQNKRIDVKLIVDSDNYYLVENTSLDIRQDFRSPFMHNKFCIIDGEKFSSGSLNPTDNGAYENNNNLLFGYSKTLALNYEDEFHEMWNGVFGKGANVENPIVYLEGIKVENYFCPEDDCADKVIRTLKKAESSIYFMTF